MDSGAERACQLKRRCLTSASCSVMQLDRLPLLRGMLDGFRRWEAEAAAVLQGSAASTSAAAAVGASKAALPDLQAASKAGASWPFASEQRARIDGAMSAAGEGRVRVRAGSGPWCCSGFLAEAGGMWTACTAARGSHTLPPCTCHAAGDWVERCRRLISFGGGRASASSSTLRLSLQTLASSADAAVRELELQLEVGWVAGWAGGRAAGAVMQYDGHVRCDFRCFYFSVGGRGSSCQFAPAKLCLCLVAAVRETEGASWANFWR